MNNNEEMKDLAEGFILLIEHYECVLQFPQKKCVKVTPTEAMFDFDEAHVQEKMEGLNWSFSPEEQSWYFDMS